MYGCESWTVKKAESWRIDAFKLWFWRRLLRVPWTAGRSNQSNLEEISPRCSLEGMMLKLKLQYSGHLMRRVDSLDKTLMLGGIGGRKKRGWQRLRWLDSITDSMDVSLCELQELVVDREACRAVIHGVSKSRTQLSDWTELKSSINVNTSCFLIFLKSLLEPQSRCPEGCGTQWVKSHWTGRGSEGVCHHLAKRESDSLTYKSMLHSLGKSGEGNC